MAHEVWGKIKLGLAAISAAKSSMFLRQNITESLRRNQGYLTLTDTVTCELTNRRSILKNSEEVGEAGLVHHFTSSWVLEEVPTSLNH
jgi:hypothetical protein